MTDQGRTQDCQVTIRIAAGSSYPEAVGAALPVDSVAGPVLILPASLQRTDPLASAVRDELRSRRLASHLLLPSNPVAALIGRSHRSPGGSWVEVVLRVPGVPPTTLTIPSRLQGHEPIWTVTDVDAVGGTGPYVLDLAARYAHPLTRLRQLASHRRSDAAADFNLAVRPSRCVVGKRIGETVVVGIVDDPIAAELFALALADEDLGLAKAVTGPWEDRVVQRATELDVGIQIPRHLTVELATIPDTVLRTALERVMARIGVSIG